jgi:prolyl-tRNA synthetase
MGTSHFLGQNFSKPFDVKYLDETNVETFAWQTSWGVSWRLIGGMIMTHGDDMGLVLPPKVAPIQVVIIPIYYSKEDREKMLLKAKQIADNISSIGIRVHLDDRDQLTPGFKFHDWELKGIPIRIEIGPKDVAKNQVVLARRYNQTKTNIASDDKMSNIAPTVQKELDDIQKQMFVAAEKILDDRIVKVSQFDQFKEELDNGKMLDCSWCGKQECEDKIKEETGADIRVITSNEQKSGICVYCKKTGVSTVLFARGY